ncbi:unnamed protein product [Eruca vesicaria subsp. sativa]|uniref:Uncharacterized protein n=1 Tax=Eruca vesicaria subsp. sativa TaxID=29727 RepID=A0ABC8LSJ8_ERUVS|nr:unnamed protein product [Eruca vesicaria subsp. sativa]
MTKLDLTRAELALVVLYLNKAEARDKICRAIQYGSKFVSGGPLKDYFKLAKEIVRVYKVVGNAVTQDRGIRLLFMLSPHMMTLDPLMSSQLRLIIFVNDFHALISHVPKGTPLPLVLLGKSKNALFSTFLFLDQIV